MKRFFKRLVDAFVKWIKSLNKVEKTIFGAWALIGCIIGILILIFIDTVPATEDDYKPLIEKSIAIEESGDLLFKEDGIFVIEDGILTIVFKNSECNISVKYDQNMKILSTTKHDKATQLYLVIILAIIGGVCGGVIVLFCLLMICMLILFLWEEVICKALKKINLWKN